MSKNRAITAITLLILCFVSMSTKAQVGEPRHNLAVGVNGGVNFNNASFQPKIKQKSLIGYTGGVTLRYVSEKYFAMICGAQLELNFSQRGWREKFEKTVDGVKVEDDSKKYSRVLNYIEMPFLAHLAFGKETKGFQFFINAGPQINFLISDSESMTPSDIKDWTLDPIYPEANIFNKKIEHKFDYGIAAGVGVELKQPKIGNFLIEGRYYYGLADFMKTTKKDYFGKASNSSICVKLTYLFDLK